MINKVGKNKNRKNNFKLIKEESEKSYHDIYMKWRNFDTLTTYLASIGFVLSIILYEINILNNYKIDTNQYPNAIDHPRLNNMETKVLRYIILVSTLMAVISLIT